MEREEVGLPQVEQDASNERKVYYVRNDILRLLAPAEVAAPAPAAAAAAPAQKTPSKARAPSNTVDPSHAPWVRGPIIRTLPGCQASSK